MEIPHILTNGGRRSGEHRDCTVRALASSTLTRYEDAHAALELAGRKDGHGVYMEKLIKNHKIPFYKFHRVTRTKQTLGRFIKSHPTGMFLAIKRGHAFAINNGAVVDMGKMGAKCIILSAWRVESEL